MPRQKLKIEDMKDSFYERLERAFNTFHKYHIVFVLGDFNAKVGEEDIFKPTTGHKSLREISNDNGVRVVNFITSKDLTAKALVNSIELTN
jgi:exonuclease III